MATQQRKRDQKTILEEKFNRIGIFTDGHIPSAVDSLIAELVGPRSSLIRVRRPSRKTGNATERAIAEENSRRERHTKTLSPIAEILGCEGFTEFCAMGVLHFARTRAGMDGEDIDACRRAFAEGMRCLTDDEKRKMAGRFVHLQGAAGFEAGLRIGLMASLWTLQLVSDKAEGR